VQEGPKENAPPAAACGAPPLRSLADPGVASAALRPLSAERAAALGLGLDAAAAAGGGAPESEGSGGEAGAAASPSRRALRSLFQE
jgi:hypothetical protein